MMKEKKDSYVRFLKENEASKQASKEKECAQQGTWTEDQNRWRRKENLVKHSALDLNR